MVIVTIIKVYTPYSQGLETGDIMYELAKTIQAERRRDADQYRLADSVPRYHSWAIGRYRFTVARRAER
jgi:hypothetical protein